MSKILGLLCCLAVCSPTLLFAAPLRIGVSLPLTGAGATYGTDIKNISDFLLKHDPDADLVFVFEDDKCDPKEAASIAQKFTKVEPVALVTGIPCSGTVLASAPIYERAKVVAISSGAGSPAISESGDYIFRARPSDVEAAKLMVTYLSSRVAQIALIAEEMDMPQGLAEAFQAAARGTRLKISRESFQSGETDLSSLLMKMEAGAPDAIVFFTQTERTSLTLVEAIRKLKISKPLYTAIFPGSPSFLNIAKSAAEGIVFATLRAREGLDAKGTKLLEQFEKEYGPMVSVDYLFPVTVAAYRAIRRCGRAPDIKECLYSTSFEGAEGEFRFDRKGDLLGMSYVMKKVANGAAVDISF